MSKIYYLKSERSPSSLSPKNEDQWRSCVNTDRDLDRLIGFIECILSDDFVDDGEILALKNWLNKHRDVAKAFPGSIIVSHLDKILKDGVIDEVERVETKCLLSSIVGGSLQDESGEDVDTSMSLPLSEPEFTIPDKVFCFSGTFVFGKRKECEQVLISIGGKSAANVSKKVDFLVLGTIVTPAWRHSSFGRKIEKAVEYGIPVISEEYFLSVAGLE